jgi:purine-binding chemotaxis protein CheW
MSATTEHTKANDDALAGMAGKYLTFSLGGESFAIPVLKVREIIRLTNITSMPQMPSCVRGVINLRGRIVPVLDLRRRFGFMEARNTEQTCIIVAQVKTLAGQSTAMGVIVDAVEEVAQLAASDIEETPDFGARVDTAFLLGMAKVRGVVKALLDIDKVIGGSELAPSPTP